MLGAWELEGLRLVTKAMRVPGSRSAQWTGHGKFCRHRAYEGAELTLGFAIRSDAAELQRWSAVEQKLE